MMNKKSLDFGEKVQYELMLGREGTERLKKYPVGYLPIGCLERHGDHLPIGLDVIKAHGICCEAARRLGGVVFPPHFYAGIHRMSEKDLRHYTREFGNLYTDESAENHLCEIIRQMEIMGVKVVVLYSGHYPVCQVEMIREIAKKVNEKHKIKVIPFTDTDAIGQGDHAGISETSLMLYLNRSLVDMSRIGEINYKDHGWSDENTPEKATAAKGEKDLGLIIEKLGELIKKSC